MGSTLLFAIPLTAILGGLSLLHAYWALGGRWGSAYTVPTISGRRVFDPTPLATWVVCGLLGLAVILVMGKAGWIGTSPVAALFDIGIWVLGLVFVLRAVGICERSVFSRPLRHALCRVGHLAVLATLLAARAP